MVDDLGREHPDPQAVGHLLGLPLHFDVERQDHRVPARTANTFPRRSAGGTRASQQQGGDVLRVVLQHRRRLHHVFLVNGADVDAGVLQPEGQRSGGGMVAVATATEEGYSRGL